MQSDFESLLRHQDNANGHLYNPYKNQPQRRSEHTKAEKKANLFDFIKMVDKLCTKTMKDLNVKFIPDEGKDLFLSNDEKLDCPTITYKVISRVVKDELKPRIRESFKEEGTDRFVEIYGQKFKCELQFNIFASVYVTAEQVMERFEEMLLKYAGYLKKEGVAEILFNGQFTDDYYRSMRQTLSIRNLRYYVEVEKLTVIVKESIKDIDD